MCREGEIGCKKKGREMLCGEKLKEVCGKKGRDE